MGRPYRSSWTNTRGTGRYASKRHGRLTSSFKWSKSWGSPRHGGYRSSSYSSGIDDPAVSCLLMFLGAILGLVAVPLLFLSLLAL